MCFARKKNKDNELRANSELLERSAAQIDFLISLAEQRQELLDKLKEAQVKIKYFTPTQEKAALALDKKIDNRLGDIKIALSKAKASGSYSYATELIDGLLLQVLERKSIQA